MCGSSASNGYGNAGKEKGPRCGPPVMITGAGALWRLAALARAAEATAVLVIAWRRVIIILLLSIWVASLIASQNRPSAGHRQALQNLFVGAGKGQLPQPASRNPLAHSRPDPADLSARNTKSIQRNPIARDGMFNRAKRVEAPRLDSKQPSRRLPQPAISPRQFEVGELPQVSVHHAGRSLAHQI